MINSKKFYFIAITIIITLGFSISLQNIIAWSVPTFTPPNSNIPAPVNVGTSTQSKDGNLLVKGFSATSSLIAGNETITGNLAVGTTLSSSYGIRVHEALYNTSGQMSIYGSAYPLSTSAGTYYNMGGGFYGRDVVSSGITNSGYIMGIDTSGYLAGSGNINSVYGARIDAGTVSGGTGAITNTYGAMIRLLNAGNGTLANAYGAHISSAKYSGTIGTAYGIFIGDMDATTGYGIYQTGSNDINYFAGNIGVGTNNPGSYKLNVAGTIYATGHVYSNSGTPLSGCVLKAYSGGVTACPSGYYVTSMTDTSIPATGSMVCCTITSSL